MLNSRIYLAAAAVSVLAMVAPVAASANVTFTDASGMYTVGIGPDGELYDNTTGVGLRNPAGSDYIAPGTPRDSWGISNGTTSAYADYEYYGTSNITGSTLTTGANTATTTSTTAMGLTVAQKFTFFSANIVSVQETVTNTTGAAQNVIFQRDVDYDVFPTEFNENTVGPFGADSQVIDSSYYGFENPDPLAAYGSSCFSGCNQQGDLGAGIKLSLGMLGAGDSTTFAYFYGINQPGQTLTGLINQAQTEGLAYTLGTQSSENGDYPNQGAGAAILGVGLVGVVAHGVPEPATWAMMLVGFGGLGLALRSSRRRQALTA